MPFSFTLTDVIPAKPQQIYEPDSWPGRRIVQSWRTTKFTKQDPDSRIEVLLETIPEGTRLTLHHTNVPDGHTGYQDGGWQQHYFDPMKQYFSEAS